MVCETPRGITIEFPAQGIEVYPIESDIRAQKRNYIRAQFRLPEAAARLVSEEVEDWTVAFIKVYGERTQRTVVPPEPLEFRHTLDEKTVGVLDLHDPRNILNRTTMNKTYDGANIDDMIEDILDRRQDEDGVITGFSIMGEDAQGWEASTILHLDDAVNEPVRFLQEEWDRTFNISEWGEKPGGLDVSGTLTEAMAQLADQFEADWWVGIGGTVYFGVREALGSVYDVGGLSSDVVLSRYSVTSTANTVSAVRLWSTPVRDDFQESGITRNRIIAVAHTDAIDGGMLSVDEDKGLDTAEELEHAAGRRLIRESIDDTSGSMEIDAIGTENNDLVRHIDVGDYVLVGEDVGVECEREVYTGLFIVQDVHHRANSRTGWTINLTVSQTISPGDIEYDSVFYDAFHDREYDTFEDFHADHPDLGDTIFDDADDAYDWAVGGTQDTADDIADYIDGVL